MHPYPSRMITTLKRYCSPEFFRVIGLRRAQILIYPSPYDLSLKIKSETGIKSLRPPS